jgi:hypothetical protein
MKREVAIYMKELFTTVKQHMLTQGAKAKRTDSAQCAYYGGNDYKCAVGCLINPMWYTDELEGKDVGNSSVMFALQLSGVYFDDNGQVLRMLKQCQSIHDNYSVDEWNEKLKWIDDTLSDMVAEDKVQQ